MVDYQIYYKIIEKELKKFDKEISIIYEYKFLKSRKFRVDAVILKYKLAIEIEGGIFSYGRHTRGLGFLRDIEKYNLLAINHFYLLKFTPTQLKNINEVLNTILNFMTYNNEKN